MLYNSPAVYTIKRIVDKKSEITYIIHDEDGEWQFLDGGDVDMSELLIVSINNILQIDPTIKYILETLPQGFSALKNQSGNWNYEKTAD